MSRLRDRLDLASDAAAGYRFAVVASRTNGEITEALLEGALDALRRHGAEHVRVVTVPGSFELPMTAAALARSGEIDAIVCIGALVRGETPHFDHLASAVAHGIQQVAIEQGLPVTFGVLTCDDVEQARARCGGAQGNKGAEAALAAVEALGAFAEAGAVREGARHG